MWIVYCKDLRNNNNFGFVVVNIVVRRTSTILKYGEFQNEWMIRKKKNCDRKEEKIQILIHEILILGFFTICTYNRTNSTHIIDKATLKWQWSIQPVHTTPFAQMYNHQHHTCAPFLSYALTLSCSLRLCEKMMILFYVLVIRLLKYFVCFSSFGRLNSA